jgi:hypothetical protein
MYFDGNIQYQINEFNAAINTTGPLKTNEQVMFTISRSANALIPMGNLRL